MSVAFEFAAHPPLFIGRRRPFVGWADFSSMSILPLSHFNLKSRRACSRPPTTNVRQAAPNTIAAGHANCGDTKHNTKNTTTTSEQKMLGTVIVRSNRPILSPKVLEVFAFMPATLPVLTAIVSSDFVPTVNGRISPDKACHTLKIRIVITEVVVLNLSLSLHPRIASVRFDPLLFEAGRIDRDRPLYRYLATSPSDLAEWCHTVYVVLPKRKRV